MAYSPERKAASLAMMLPAKNMALGQLAKLEGLSLPTHSRWRADARVGPQSRVLVFGTEDDTDPALYKELFGRLAADVRARA